MTPDERLELEACLKRASEILYKNSGPERLESLEDIENKVREQVLTEVSPRIALFLSSKRQERVEAEKES